MTRRSIEAARKQDREPLVSVLRVLAALDGVLSAAVSRAEQVLGDPGGDPFRGLHLGADEVKREIAQPAAVPAYAEGHAHDPSIETGLVSALLDSISGHSRLTTLARTHGLDGFESACLVLALAPEIDLRYERIYAYLQNDVTRKRPTAGLALDLFCRDAVERYGRLGTVAPGGVMFASHVLEAPPVTSSRLAIPLVLEDDIVGDLLGEQRLDPRLAAWCRLEPRREWRRTKSALVPIDVGALARVARQARKRGEPFIAHFRGAHGTHKGLTASRLADRLHRRLLLADLRGAMREADVAGVLHRLFRTASSLNAVLFIHGYDAAGDNDRQSLRALASALSSTLVPTIIAGTREWSISPDYALPVISLEFDHDEVHRSRAAWARALAASGAPVEAGALAELSDRFRLTPADVAATVASAAAQHRWNCQRDRGTADTPLGIDDVARVARARSGGALASLAQRIRPRRRWRDLVLPPDTLATLREVCARVEHRSRVLDDWGFDGQLSLGKGIAVLFAGPSGTGKTLAAEVLACELQLDLFRVDLANVVSKYIGETEKNLDRVFEAARGANGVLLFDEADAILGKRTDVRDAHDRYANLEVSYLLQKMEAFDGLAILSTNMRQNIDDAFTRRLTFTVHFPFPEEADRRRIWEIIWPDRVPRAADVDAAVLARELMLSGGHIKNAALAAAFYAAADGGVVTRAHVLQAARREFQKMGKVVAS